MNGYKVIEFYYDQPDTVQVVASFTDESEAVAFSDRHYYTQIDIPLDDPCKCGECAEGWRVLSQNWNSYVVQVEGK